MIYGVGSVLNRVISFLLLPIFTAYLTPEDYGISAILALICFFATSLFSLGVNVSLAPCYYGQANRQDKSTIVWTAALILAISSIVLISAGLLSLESFSQIAFQTTRYTDLVALSVFTAVFSILSTPFMLYPQFEERAKEFVILSIISTTLSIGVSFFLVVIMRYGVKGLVIGGFIGQVLNFLLFFVPFVIRTKIAVNLSYVKELLKLGLPLVPSAAFLFIIQDGNKYLLKLYNDIETVGVYTIGVSLGLIMSLLVSAFQRAWLPFFMSFIDSQDEGAVVFKKAMTYYFYIFGTFSILFFLAAKPVVLLMTQPAFHESYKVVGLSATAQFFIGVFYLLLPGMYFTKEVKYVALIQFSSAAIAIVLNILLIKHLSYLGAGLGLMLGFFIMVVLTLLWNYRRKEQYIQVTYEWTKLAAFSIVYLLFSAASLFERNFSMYGEIVFSIALFLLFLSVLYFIIGAENKAWIKTQLIHISNRFHNREITQQPLH